MIEKDNNYYYKGYYYYYDSVKNNWILFTDWITGNLHYFNGDYYRLDQCFDYVLNDEI